MKEPLNIDELVPLLARARDEDLGSGDLTSEATIPASATAVGHVVARQAGVVCGLALLEPLAGLYSGELTVGPIGEDGMPAEPGEVVATLRGPARAMLAMERVALNFLQRLGGIATLTARYVAAVRGTGAAILDTRKTTPGWRTLEKYAVRCGGGENHRVGLFDAILVKDNHLVLAGRDAGELVDLARSLRENHGKVTIEIEVDTLAQFRALLTDAPGAADIVLLDNMRPAQLAEAVKLRDELSHRPEGAGVGRPLLEASGGVTLETVREIAETGVDRISIGALTHSATALDLSLEIEPE